jgi:SAM-dependent methyltransferase
VLGFDYAAATVAHARATYPQAAFVRANLAALPVQTESVDIVVSLQVIEHVWNHPEFVGECRRVLRPGGSLVVSTPNRLTFSPGLETPVNPFHTHEFTAAELTGLLSHGGLEITGAYGLHAGPRLQTLDDAHAGFVAAQLAESPDRWTARLAADVAAVGVEDFAVTTAAIADIDTSLDLIVIARRPL